MGVGAVRASKICFTGQTSLSRVSSFLTAFLSGPPVSFSRRSSVLVSFISFAATFHGILVRGFWSVDCCMRCSSTIDRDAAGCSGHRTRSLGWGIQVILARCARLHPLPKQEPSGGAFRSFQEWAHLEYLVCFRNVTTPISNRYTIHCILVTSGYHKVA